MKQIKQKNIRNSMILGSIPGLVRSITTYIDPKKAFSIFFFKIKKKQFFKFGKYF